MNRSAIALEVHQAMVWHVEHCHTASLLRVEIKAQWTPYTAWNGWSSCIVVEYCVHSLHILDFGNLARRKIRLHRHA
jgi:hypothetical protein